MQNWALAVACESLSSVRQVSKHLMAALVVWYVGFLKDENIFAHNFKSDQKATPAQLTPEGMACPRKVGSAAPCSSAVLAFRR